MDAAIVSDSACSVATDSEDDAEMDKNEAAIPLGPSDCKRQKLCREFKGSAVYPTVYQQDWEKTHDFVAKSSKSKHHFYCKACCKDVSIGHQGILDIKRHASGKIHKQLYSSIRSHRPLNYKSSSDSFHQKVTAAEVRNTVMLAHHNTALCLSDHIGHMQRKNFPDSEIAKSYHCARTKTACILNYAVAPSLKSELVCAMKQQPYSLSVDASNDSGLAKMNPITVRLFDVNKNIVSQKFLDICLTSGTNAAKASEIFLKIDDVLKQCEITWDNCISFGVDNTNSNIGAVNSIKSRVIQINPSIYFLGCPCHIVHNAARKAADAFRHMSKFDIEDCCIDHFYWFDKSTKRKGELSKYAVFCDTTYRRFIKHISVRWLSLEKAVERILQMYSASKSYFMSEGMGEARFKRLEALYEDPMFEIYLLFFQATLPLFTTFNLFLQRDAPQIYLLHRQMQLLLLKLLTKFMKPLVTQKFRQSKLIDIPYAEVQNHVENSSLYIGLVTSSEIRKKLNNGDITQRNVDIFYLSVKEYYMSAVTYILKWFPLNEPLIRDSEFVDFDKKEECGPSGVLTFVDRYPRLLHFSHAELDRLNEEFLDYQSLSKSDIPSEVWESSVCYEVSEGSEKRTYHRMDTIWGHLSHLQLPGLESLRFPFLSRVAKLILTIPHSNAAEERVFSVIRKIKRDDRGMLQLDGTLSSLVMVKINLPETKETPCYAFNPTQELLQGAKSATSYYNKVVCSSSQSSQV